MKTIDLMFLILIYLLIGLWINWKTEPQDRFKVRRYHVTSWIVLFIDLFFWPFEVLIYFSIRKNRQGWK
jgi:hypothetical protein